MGLFVSLINSSSRMPDRGIPPQHQCGNVVLCTMINLRTNYLNLIIRCCVVLFFFIAAYFLIRNELQNPEANSIIFWKVNKMQLFFVLVITPYSLFIWLTIISVLGIINVQVDKGLSTATFTSFLSKKAIPIEDIESYYETTHINIINKWNGVLLKLKSGKSIQLVEQNLLSISDFKDYLNEKTIPCRGKRRMKFPFN